MGSIVKRQGGWQVRWRELDGRQRGSTCPTRDLARRLLREIEEAHALGHDWRPDGRLRLPLLEQAFLEALRDRRRSLGQRSHRQVTLCCAQLVAYLRARDPSREPALADLSRQTIADWWDHLVHVRECARRTATHKVRRVEDVWQRMTEREDWGEHVPIPRRLRDLPVDPVPRAVAPTWAEMDGAVLATRQTRDPERFWRLFQLARFTGLRMGQLLALEWRDVDLDTRLLTVRPELGKSVQERRGRIVPMSEHLTQEMAGWGLREGRIVPRADVPMSYYTLRNCWRRSGAREEVWAGREGRRGSPMHAFRHGLITGLQALGAEVSLVQALVGHSQGSVTGDVYTDSSLMLEPLREVVALVPRIGEAGRVERLRSSGS